MPLYRVKCDVCEAEDDVFRSIAVRDHDLPLHCGEPMHRVVTAPHFQPDLAPYQSMITGQMIHGRREHREHLREHNCREIGNDLTPLTKNLNKDRDMVVPAESAARRKKLVADLVDQKLRG
jgi:hypothetical protein